MKTHKQLKAIFFDIDDTLFPSTSLTTEARAQSVKAMIKHGLNVPFAVVLKELNETIAEFSSNYAKHFDKLLLRLPKNSYKAVNSAVIVAAAISAYHDVKIKRLHAYEDAVEVLKLLTKTDLLLGVISAGLTVKQAEKLVRMQLTPFFNSRAIFITDQIGINKTNPKLYQRVCSDLNLSPGACMFVGNNPLSDIDPANEVGMVTVFSKRAGKYASVVGVTNADFAIDNFWDLLDILKTEYGLDCLHEDEPEETV